MTIYKLLRNTHLFLGIAAFLFLLMYGLSAVQMAHDSWFTLKPSVTESQIRIPDEIGDDPRAVAQYLRRAGFRGELGTVEATESGVRLQITRPGTVYQIGYTKSTRQARIRTSTATFMGVLNRIHHLAGTWHDYWPIDAWGVFVGLTSAVLIILGATGIYLWFKIHDERTIGIVLLAVNLGICVSLLTLVRTA